MMVNYVEPRVVWSKGFVLLSKYFGAFFFFLFYSVISDFKGAARKDLGASDIISNHELELCIDLGT